MYDLDDIDEIILFELSNPILYSNFIKKMSTYFEDEEEDEESKSEFLFLLNNRLRNYLIINH